MTSTSPEAVSEAVNGKIDLGVRKLRASYVENATTIYAYLETDFHVLGDYTDKITEAYQTATKPDDNDNKVKEEQIYLVFSDKDKCVARGRIEQAKAGPGGSKVKLYFE